MLQLAAKDSSEVARINGYARDPHVAWYWSLKEAGSNAAVVAQLNEKGFDTFCLASVRTAATKGCV